MSLTRAILLRASKSPWLAEQVMRRKFAKRAVKRFLPGEELEDALTVAADLAERSIRSILTKLGENLAAVEEADAVRDHYLGVFDQVKKRGLPSVVSVKPTQLGLDHSIDVCAEHLEVLAQAAESAGSTLWIDMEDSTYVDRTLDLYRGVKGQHQRVGLALQSYLRRTPNDLQSLLPLKPIVRLVKGAYAESAEVAFPAKRDTDQAYFDLADVLLRAATEGAALPIFGTHDLGLIDRILSRANELGVRGEEGAFEIHMLFGIRMAEQRALAAKGQTVGTLLSYGSAWFPWYLRRLAERPANVWFVLRSMLARDSAE